MSDTSFAPGRTFVLDYYARRRDALTNAARDADPARLYDELAHAALPTFAQWIAVVESDRDAVFSRCTLDHDHAFATCATPWVQDADIDAAVAQVLASGDALAWSDGGPGTRGVLTPLVVDERPAGVVVMVRASSAPPFSDDDLDAAHDVVTALGVDIERLRLRHQSRLAVRASQRIASQLHQLFSVSLAMGAPEDEGVVVESLSRSARSVFDADQATLGIRRGDEWIVGLTARGQTSRILDEPRARLEGAPLTIRDANETWEEGEWLCAPVLDGHRRSRGVVGVRRGRSVGFSNEDRELAMLLGQLAATSLETLDFNRTIHDNEVRLRILVDAAPVSIIESDAHGGVRWWNRAASRLLRWPDFTGEETDVTWPDDVAPVVREMWRDLLAGGLRDTHELNARIAGRDRLLSVSVAVLPGGADRHLLTLLDDVTDQRELREEVRHAHRMELRGQVASSVAHDFNNLITLILGYAELLSREVAGDEKSEALVEEIQATSSRASRLTAQLQSLGRTAPTAPVRVDATDMLRRNAEVLERIMGSNTVVEWHLADATPEVTVDADLFEQMILNLCINARDAMPDGGLLTLRTEVHDLAGDDPRVLGASGTHVALSITDTGTGMDEATRARCFEPLFTTKGPFKGTGLGLASARRLVEESGGVITCDSVLGVGTTFTVWLPAHDAPERIDTDDRGGEARGDALAGEHATPRPRARESTSGTVLLCEDDDALRRLALRALQRNGLNVLEAVSGEDALDFLTRFDGAIDVLVSDVVLPEMTGQELAERLQRDRPDLLVVLMSGTASPEVIDGLVSGSATFVAKPFRPSELIDTVLALLRRRAPRAS